MFLFICCLSFQPSLSHSRTPHSSARSSRLSKPFLRNPYLKKSQSPLDLLSLPRARTDRISDIAPHRARSSLRTRSLR